MPAGHRGRTMDHPSRSVASIAIVALVLLLFGSVEESRGDFIVRKPSRSLRSSHSLVEVSSNVDNTSELQQCFEVSRPITVTGDSLVETIQLLQNDFAYTYGHLPANASYVPTNKVLDSSKWNKVVLNWSAVSQGVQYDRIAGVWLGGVEIFRTCTEEPTAQGIVWDVEKDVTRYASLWKKPQEVVVLLNNIFDSTYTGIYNVTLSVQFYHGSTNGSTDAAKFQDDAEKRSYESNLEDYADKPADLIIPIREATDVGEWGYWFSLSSETDEFNTSLQVPGNTYKAVLEVCVSSHGDDEFWYTVANGVNATFREVVVSMDDEVVGAIYPFIVVYTGGFDPSFWQPAVAIGAFDLPSYDLDITPLLGKLLDGNNHTFSLTVTDALDYWLLQANLHIWVDPKSNSTIGSVVTFSVPSSTVQLESNSSADTITTTASRNFSYVGYVASSFGNLTTSSSYTLKFSNIQSPSTGTFNQQTETEGTVVLKNEETELISDQTVSSYPFYFDSSSGIEHSLKIDINHSETNKSGSFSSLSNNQSALADGTQQTLSYQGSDGCYQRAIDVQNNVLVSDNTTTHCG